MYRIRFYRTNQQCEFWLSFCYCRHFLRRIAYAHVSSVAALPTSAHVLRTTDPDTNGISHFYDKLAPPCLVYFLILLGNQ